MLAQIDQNVAPRGENYNPFPPVRINSYGDTTSAPVLVDTCALRNVRLACLSSDAAKVWRRPPGIRTAALEKRKFLLLAARRVATPRLPERAPPLSTSSARLEQRLRRFGYTMQRTVCSTSALRGQEQSSASKESRSSAQFTWEVTQISLCAGSTIAPATPSGGPAVSERDGYLAG